MSECPAVFPALPAGLPGSRGPAPPGSETGVASASLPGRLWGGTRSLVGREAGQHQRLTSLCPHPAPLQPDWVHGVSVGTVPTPPQSLPFIPEGCIQPLRGPGSPALGDGTAAGSRVRPHPRLWPAPLCPPEIRGADRRSTGSVGFLPGNNFLLEFCVFLSFDTKILVLGQKQGILCLVSEDRPGGGEAAP